MQIGNGVLDQVFLIGNKAFEANGDQPMVGLTYSARGVAGEVPTLIPYRATVASTVAPVITFTLYHKTYAGVASTTKTWTLTGGATNSTAWAGTSPTFTATASTLKGVIDLLNLIPGVDAHILHGPYNHSTNATGYFTAVTTTEVTNGCGPVGVNGGTRYTEILRHDDSDDNTIFIRCGYPEPRDRNALKFLDIEGSITSETGGTVVAYKDNVEDYTGSAKTAYLVNSALAAARTSYINKDVVNAPVFQGSVVVQIAATNIAGASYRVKVQQASIGV
jgi:hypothetical protein